MATIFRAPLIIRIEQRRSPVAVEAQGYVQSNALTSNLLGKDQFFGAPGEVPDYDWPLPTPPKPFPSDLRTHTEGVKLNLLGQDKFFTSPGQGPSYDWPNPIRGTFPVSLRGWTDGFKNNLFSAVAAPFKPLGWPNPHERQRMRKGWIAFFSMLDQDTFFGEPGMGPSYEYPNPRGRRRGPADWTLPSNLSLNTAPVAPPFKQTDHPLPPAGYQFSRELRTFTNSVELTLLGKDQFFSAAGVGPVYDYPNPRGKEFASDLRTHVEGVKLNLIGKDKFFAAPGMGPSFDWPNPRGRGPASTLRTFIGEAHLLTLPPPAPGSALDDGRVTIGDAYYMTSLNATIGD